MDIDDVRDMLRELSRPTTSAALSERLGVSPSYVSDVMLGRREPGPKLLAALGLRRVVSYVRAGASENAPSLLEALHDIAEAKLEDALGPHHLALCMKQLAREALDTAAARVPGRANGGHARAEALSPQRRSEIAKAGALARWAKGKDNKP